MGNVCFIKWEQLEHLKNRNLKEYKLQKNQLLLGKFEGKLEN